MTTHLRLLAGIVLCTTALATRTSLAQPHSDHDLEAEKARADSLNKAVLWHAVVPLVAKAHVVDVAFAAVGRNIVTPVEIAWLLADSPSEMVAMAARPIAGTADAGEELGRRGGGSLRQPIALHATTAGSTVLERDGRLMTFRGSEVDSVGLDLGGKAARDLAVGDAGLIYVLTETEVRVWSQTQRGAPLWKMTLPPALLPAVALTVSARGEIFVCGNGKTAVAVFDLDARGRYAVQRQCTATQAGLRAAGGVSLLEAMLLPIPGREGWVNEDRYLVVSDRTDRTLVALDAKSLRPVGRAALAADLPDAVPGRLDVNNRGQVALVDAERGLAWSLPTRILASALEQAPIRWRRIGAADSTASDTTRTRP